MSRFADPAATERMSLGSCLCPGKPHDEDWIEMRTELGSQDVVRMAVGDSIGVLTVLVKDWNLLDTKGRKPEVNEESLALLFSDTFDTLDAWIEDKVRVRTTLPNGSAAPSRSSTRGSGFQTRKAKRAV